MAAAETPAPQPGPLTRDVVALMLGRRRDRLVIDVPRKVAAARRLTRDQHEAIVDEAIAYLVMEYAKPLPTPDDLERVLWKAINVRVRWTIDGRHELVRNGWARVDIDDLETVPDEKATPEDVAVRHFELATLREFQAILTEDERTVLALKYSGPKELGRFEIAKVIGRRPFEVRRAERSIVRKLTEFSEIIAAGRLCDERHHTLEVVAKGSASDDERRLARLHLAYCMPCRAEYKDLVRAVHSGELPRQIGQLLPAPTIEMAEHRRGPWEAAVDWLSRPFGHDATVTITQIAPAGRGLSTLAGVKVLAMCVGGIATVGGGLFCVTKVTHHPPKRITHVVPEHRHHVDPKDDRARPVPTAAIPTPTPTAIATPKPVANKTQPKGGEVSGGLSSHEKAAAVSPPVTTSSGGRMSEFGPGPSSTTPLRPAAAPVNGGPEFP